MLTLKQLIEAAQSLPEEVQNAQVNIQVTTEDEHGNQTQYVLPLEQVYVLMEDNYVGPSGVFSYTELDAMMSKKWGIEEPGDETMDDYDLYVRKNQAILYAEPLHCQSPLKKAPLRVYSRELDVLPQEEPGLDLPDTAIPHLRLEVE